MNSFFKSLRCLGWFFAGALTLLGMGLLAIWFHPSIVLNDSTAVPLRRYLGSQGIRLSWTTLHLSASSLSFWQKQVELVAEGFCFEDGQTKACFPVVDLQLQVRFKGGNPYFNVSRLQLQAGKVSYISGVGPVPLDAAPAVSSETLFPKPPAFLNYVNVQGATLGTTQLRVVTSDWEVLGSVDLDLKKKGTGSVAQINFKGTAKTGGDIYEGAASVVFQSVKSPWFGPYLVHGQAGAKGPGKQTLRLSLAVQPGEKDSVSYQMEGAYREGKKSVVAEVRGDASAQHVTGLVGARLQRLSKNLPNLELEECRVQYRQKPGKPKSRFQLHCPAQLTGGFPLFKGGPREKLSHTTKGVVELDVSIGDLPNQPDHVTGSLSLTMDPIFQNFKPARATIVSSLSGELRDFPDNLFFDAKTDVEIEKFQDVVRLLENSPWAVPSPFNPLEGSVHLSAKGKGSIGKWEAKIPVTLGLRLLSPGQRLEIDAEGTLFFRNGSGQPDTHLQMGVTLRDVQLTLPYLSMKLPPKAFADRRIKGSFERQLATKKQPEFSYDIRVQTAKHKPLRLISNLAEKPIPLDLALLISSHGGVRGSLRILSFPAELFRRKSSIKYFDISLNPDPAKSEVRGEIQVLYTDYTIRILILGLLNQPEIRFLSEPPLPEDKVIATLLFGKPPEQLDENQTASIGGTRSAIADSAVSLASMYLLASTPVESVGYDPATRGFKARVRLADGTSLNVGSDLRELNEIGVRRRLGAHWAIATYFQNPLDPVERTATAFLEWSTRY